MNNPCFKSADTCRISVAFNPTLIMVHGIPVKMCAKVSAKNFFRRIFTCSKVILRVLLNRIDVLHGGHHSDRVYSLNMMYMVIVFRLKYWKNLKHKIFNWSTILNSSLPVTTWTRNILTVSDHCFTITRTMQASNAVRLIGLDAQSTMM